MSYVDGFVLPVPRKNLPKYRRMARAAGKAWKRHGALEYFECVGDDLHPKIPGMTPVKFPKMAKAKPNETVVFSFIVFKSRAHRDRVNKSVMREFEKAAKKEKKEMQMPFDVRRMAYGGFKAIAEE